MALYGVGLDTTVERLNIEFKLAMSRKGGASLKVLKDIFQKLDKNGNNKLELDEFKAALNKFGFFPKFVDLQAIHKYYDLDGDGYVNFEEFLQGLREPLKPRRLNIVNKVFDKFVKIDAKNRDSVLLTDLQNGFNVFASPDYQKGFKTKEQIYSDFASNFPSSPTNEVNRQDFIRFYEGISLCISSDEVFMMRINNGWGVMEDEESQVSEELIKSVLKSIRFKLIQKTNGNHDEFVMRKIFREFDSNGNGSISVDELVTMLVRIEIPVQKKFLIPIFKKFDRNGNGMVEIEEFINFVINNPYP